MNKNNSGFSYTLKLPEKKLEASTNMQLLINLNVLNLNALKVCPFQQGGLFDQDTSHA